MAYKFDPALQVALVAMIKSSCIWIQLYFDLYRSNMIHSESCCITIQLEAVKRQLFSQLVRVGSSGPVHWSSAFG